MKLTRKNIKKNIRNSLKFTQKILIGPVYYFLRIKERSLINNTQKLKHAPMFIVGNPRSGTTLLYQTIANYFKVCYFSNLMNLFPASPICTAYLVSRLNGCSPPSFFRSVYGWTPGWRSPNQAEYIWKRWFNDLYAGSTIFSEIDLFTVEQIRNSIGLLQKYYNAPSVHKWQPLSEKIIALSNIFPNAIFLRIKRKKEFIAQSILCSKRKLWNDDNRWFSTKPRNYKKIVQQNYLVKICEQVSSIEDNIDSDIEIIGKDKCFVLHYEDLCNSPHMIMNKLHEFYTHKNTKKIKKRKPENVPAEFICGNNIKLDKHEFRLIKAYLKNSMKDRYDLNSS